MHMATLDGTGSVSGYKDCDKHNFKNSKIILNDIYREKNHP